MQNQASKRPAIRLLWISALLVLAGLVLILAQFFGDYALLVNGARRELRGWALTSGQLLRAAGYDWQPADEIFPAPAKLNLTHTTIILNQARPVSIQVGSEVRTLLSAETLPANLLAEAGLDWFPRDILLWNSEPLRPDEPLPPGEPLSLEFVPAKKVVLQFAAETLSFFTQQETLGGALDEAGISLRPEDALSQPLDSVLTAENTISVRLAREINVRVGGQQYSGLSAAESVGGALRDLGLPLQNLDYAEPDESQPVPADGQVRIVRVSEEILLQTEETAYNNSYEDDPEAELDTVSVLVPGQIGLVVTRDRLLLEDGVEKTRQTDGPWKASDPEDGVLGLSLIHISEPTRPY